MFKTCYLHIGLGKTGTTSIQEELLANRTKLREQDIICPGEGPSHIFLASAFSKDPKPLTIHLKANRIQDTDIIDFNQKRLATLRKTADEYTGKTAILSCEHLSVFDEEEAASLLAFLYEVAREVNIICYVREPLEHTVSLHLEYVRQSRANLGEINVDQYLSPKKVIEAFQAAICDKPGSIITKKYQRARGTAWNLCEDFLLTIGADIRKLDLTRSQTSNARYCREALEMINMLNQAEPKKKSDGRRNPNRAFDLDLSPIQGQKYVLPEGSLAEIEPLAAADKDYLKTQFGIEFDDNQRPHPKQTSEPADTQLSIAKLLNQQALEIERLHSVVYFKEGVEAKARGDIELAEEKFLQAIQLTSSYRAPLRALAELYIELGQADDAVAICQQYVEINTNDPRFPSLLAQVLIETNDLQQARGILEYLAANHPHFREAQQTLRKLDQADL